LIPYKIVDNTLIKMNKLPITNPSVEKKEIHLFTL
jgi:hypothetical protein